MKKKKNFGCNQECKSDCCSYTVLYSIVPATKKPDIAYNKLHNIEVKEVELDVEQIKIKLDEAMKEIKHPMIRLVKPLILKLIKAMFKQYAFKVPLVCNWRGKDGKCINYESRPDVCKKGDGNDRAFPIEECPY